MDWTEIVGLILLGLSIFLGIRWQKAKNVLRETSEALACISDAVEDDKVTKEEAQKILAECKDVVIAAKELVSK
jgi:hypothetical protein